MKKRVLFLCTGNSCRSQMAEGFLRNLAPNRFECYSAGIHPTHVDTLSIKVMKEIGIDISRHTSKSVKDLPLQRFDYIITVCGKARERCPVIPGSHRKIHWDLTDPAETKGTEEEKLKIFRRIRDQIKELVKEFSESPEK